MLLDKWNPSEGEFPSCFWKCSEEKQAGGSGFSVARGPFSFAGFWFMAPQPRERRLDVLKPTMWYLSQNKQVLGKKTHRKRSAGQATGFRERMFTPLKRSWLTLVVSTSYKGVALPFSGWPMLTGNRRYSYAFSKTPRLRPAKTDWHFVSTERTQKRGPEQGSFITVLHLPWNAGILQRKLLITSRFHARIPTRAVQKTQLGFSDVSLGAALSFHLAQCSQHARKSFPFFLQESLLVQSHVDGSPGQQTQATDAGWLIEILPKKHVYNNNWQHF